MTGLTVTTYASDLDILPLLYGEDNTVGLKRDFEPPDSPVISWVRGRNDVSAMAWRWSQRNNAMRLVAKSSRAQVFRNLVEVSESDTVGKESASRREKLVTSNILASVRRLEDGWMGDDSLAPSKEVIADAEEFLKLLMLEVGSFERPMVSASACGDLTLRWANERGKATVRLEGEGIVGYALFRAGRYHAAAEDVDLESSSLPNDLKEYIRSLSDNDMQL